MHAFFYAVLAARNTTAQILIDLYLFQYRCGPIDFIGGPDIFKIFGGVKIHQIIALVGPEDGEHHPAVGVG